MIAGLSFGEYSALVASGTLGLEDVVALVIKRGEFMETAAPAGTGKMVAVMNTGASLIEEICQKASNKRTVTSVSCNTPTQIVIGGETEAVNYTAELLKEAGVKRLILLKVSGPFHTALLQSASERLVEVLDGVTSSEFQVPLIDNIEAKVMDHVDIKALLAGQAKESARLYDSIETMREFGMAEVIEVGLDKVSSRFLRKIDKAIPALTVEGEASLEALLEKQEKVTKVKDRNVLATGLTHGTGLTIARQLASLSANIVLNGCSGISQDLIDSFKDYRAKVAAISGDMSDSDDVRCMVDGAIGELGPIDISVNNAGITNDRSMLKMSKADSESMFKANLTGAFNMIQSVLRPMTRARQGVIIDLSSVVGLTGGVRQTSYAAPRVGLIGLMKSVAHEAATRGVHADVTTPGFIESDMTDAIPEKMQEATLVGIPMKCIGKVEEVASVASFLAQQDYLTGQVIAVDDGMTMQ